MRFAGNPQEEAFAGVEDIETTCPYSGSWQRAMDVTLWIKGQRHVFGDVVGVRTTREE